MKNITWITADYFLQVDFPILYKLKDVFKINWIVCTSPHSEGEKTSREYAAKYHIQLSYFLMKHHRYSPLTYWEYKKYIKIISEWNSDIYYFNIIAFPYLLFAIKKYIPSAKVVMAMHHGKAPTAIRFRYLYQRYINYLTKQHFKFQYFSESQSIYYTGNSTKKFVIQLSLNNYGSSKLSPPKDKVVFLYFGVIVDTKFVDGIIKAAQLLNKRCKKPFKVVIAGYCSKWEKYKKLITEPDLFELKIQHIPDSALPDLFSGSHYQLLPYTFVSQSGALRMAYGYNLPVIASDLDGFKESVINGITGIICHVGDVESLANVMQQALKNHPQMYESIRAKQAAYIHDHYSQDAIINKYIKMFNQV